MAETPPAADGVAPIEPVPGRVIAHTDVAARHPWPADCYIQGGARGVVLSAAGNYRTAFVEVCPRNPNTFLRGEGPTIEAAEDHAWAQYEKMTACPAHPQHGPWDRRGYRNGAAFCQQCGTWFSSVLDELPPQPGAAPSALEQLLAGDPTEVITEMADTLDIERSGDLLTDTLAIAREVRPQPPAPAFVACRRCRCPIATDELDDNGRCRLCAQAVSGDDHARR